MRPVHKLIAATMLALLLQAWVPLAVCAQGSAGAMGCSKCCRWGARAQTPLSGTQLRAQHSAPCCKVTSSHPAPPAATTTGVRSPSPGRTPLVAAALTVAPASANVAVSPDPSPPPLPALQARLCIFQI